MTKRRTKPAPALDLRPLSDVFDTHRRRFFDSDLPPALSAKAFERFDATKYDERTLSVGRSAWQLRTLDEYRSYIAFTTFLETVNGLGLAFDVLSTLTRVVRDEARHVELCRRLVNALGGDDVIPGTPTWVGVDEGASPLMQAMQTVVGSLCVGETLSVALLLATRDVTADPLAKAVLTVLSADESVHSQSGWTLLPVLWAVLSKGERKQLERELAGTLEYARTAVFAGAQYEATDGARSPFGELFTSERDAVYRRSMQQHVLKRFRKLGINVEG